MRQRPPLTSAPPRALRAAAGADALPRKRGLCLDQGRGELSVPRERTRLRTIRMARGDALVFLLRREKSRMYRAPKTPPATLPMMTSASSGRWNDRDAEGGGADMTEGESVG